MRNFLALSFVVAAVATTSALPVSRSDLALGTHTAREYSAPMRPGDSSRDITRDQEKAQRERVNALRPDNPSELKSSPGQGQNGGVFATPPAIGANADDGGSSFSSPNALSESGSSLDVLQNTVQPGGPLQFADSQDSEDEPLQSADSQDSQDRPLQSAESQDSEDKSLQSADSQDSQDKFYNPGGAYGYARGVGPRAVSSSKRLRMRQLNLNDPIIKDVSSDDTSNNDGGDGTATQGTATPGGGTNGGSATAGTTGSVKGGTVHNDGAFKAPSLY